MSFNIRYDNINDKENQWDYRKQEVAKHILGNQPDFLGIQEGLYTQVSFLKEQLTFYKFIGKGRDDGKKKGEFSAIFYNSERFELLNTETFWLSKTPDSISKGWDAALPRIATYGYFKEKHTGKEVHVINTHFDHRGITARIESAKLIVKKIKQMDLLREKLILMGDLNANPDDTPIRIFSENLDDAKSISKSFNGPEGTFNGFEKDMESTNRIDYIFTKNFKINRYQHLDAKRSNGLWVSDHHAVMAEIEF